MLLVGKRQEGQQEVGAINAFWEHDWFVNVCKSITLHKADGLKDACEDIYLIGFTYWIKTSIDLSNVKLIFYADKLGSSFGLHQNILMLVGGEQVSFGDHGQTLDDFLSQTS
jgi:hypothetical protein